METTTLNSTHTETGGKRSQEFPHHHQSSFKPKKRNHAAPIILISAFVLVGIGLTTWKIKAMHQAGAAAANQPEPSETIGVAMAKQRQHRHTTTAIGTVMALRSISLRNELAGTVREVSLKPGQVVEQGALLVALDVSVEEAELKAQEAEVTLAETLLGRLERALQNRATSQVEVDRARAQLDVAKAQIERIRAVIARKTIRAPFRARVGISDVHPGQYLEAGTLLTTLQGVDSAAHIDFSVPQQVGQGLKEGESVEVISSAGQPPISAEIVALDSRVDPLTRSTAIRARIANAHLVPPPGASVRVRVPAGAPLTAVSVPVSALRKGPGGDHLYVIENDAQGVPRAKMRLARAAAIFGDEALLLSGISEGEQVAADGSFKLRDNVRVNVTTTNTLSASR